MAKVNFEFDTVDKTMAVTMDGQKMDNAVSVFAGKSYDGKNFWCEIGMMDSNEDEGYNVMHRLCASEKGEFEDVKDVVRDIQKYFARPKAR